MQLITTSFFIFMYSFSAQALLIVSPECIREAGPERLPTYTTEDLARLEIWINASATLAFANSDMGINYDRDAFMASCPNRGLFNYGLATGCIQGLAERFTQKTNFWQTRRNSVDHETLRQEVHAAIEQHSRDVGIDINTLLPATASTEEVLVDATATATQ